MEHPPWYLTNPDGFEADLAHHWGPRAFAEYVQTLQTIDAATARSERAALRGRSRRAMAKAFRRILGRLPFPVLGLHPGNGSKFLSNQLVRLRGEESTAIQLRRRTPHRMNDDRFVEQRCPSLARAYPGAGRHRSS